MSRRGESQLDPYIDDIRSSIASGETQHALARRLGVNRSTLNTFMLKHDIRRSAPTRDREPAARELPKEVSREDRLDAEVKELRQHIRKTHASSVAQERVLLAIEDAVADLEPLDVLHRDNPLPAEDAHHRQAVLLSDWHGGEVVLPEQVGGLNEFNWEILEDRVDRTIASLLSFKAVRPELTGLDIWFLGDMVSGSIHEELVATNEFPVAKQAVQVGRLMARVVAELAPHYPDIWVAGISGNHARTKKDHASKNVFDSWDWTAYQLAAAMTQSLSHVDWAVPESGSVVRTIAGNNVLLFHGDGIRSSMPGVPWGGVMRRTNELRKQYAEMGILLHGAALGHFHQANVTSGGIYMNGSLIGTNEYGYKNFGGGEIPKQLLLTFDETKKRLTDVSYITP